MVDDSAVAARIEELWELCAQELGEAPGKVLNRLARAELSERDTVIEFLKRKGLDGVADEIAFGAHHAP